MQLEGNRMSQSLLNTRSEYLTEAMLRALRANATLADAYNARWHTAWF